MSEATVSPGMGSGPSEGAPAEDGSEPKKTTAGHPLTGLRKAHDGRSPVEGKVVAIVRGGYEVDLDGVKAFCPFNQIDIRRNDDQLSFIHQSLRFLITSFKRRGRSIALSRRRFLEREARKAERDLRRKIRTGSIQVGVIASLSDFGAFVDMGGVQGMIHVSEISHERLGRPSEKLSVGDKVRVKVLKADPQKGRIALSLKALEADPWLEIPSRFRVNEVVAGRVVRVTEFGVFVEVAPGVDGLIHVSELPEGGLEAMKESARSGAEVAVQVLRIDTGKKRISLAPAPEGKKPGDRVPLQNTRPGALVTGRVESVSAEGVVIRLDPGRIGVIAPNETATPRGADLRHAFPVGTEVKAMVMAGEKSERRIRLSIRRAERREEQLQLQDYRRSAASGAGTSLATLGDFFRKKE